jgi:hypothetical protein
VAVTYYQLNRSTTSIPSTAGTASYTDGFYGVPGTMEFLIWRLELTLGGTVARTTSVASLINQFKLVVDGDILYDWTSGFAPETDSTSMGNWNYFLNTIGGRSYEVPAVNTGTSVDVYMAIPVGAILSQGTPRFEITYGFYDANLVLGSSATISSGASTYWARFNQAAQRQTRVVSGTSFQHTANQSEQVVVRVPSMPGYVLDAVLIQNDSPADQYGADGIRALALSQFSMPIDLHRWASDELGNTLMVSNPGAGTDAESAQVFKTSTPGILRVPLYGLKAADLTMIVNSSATTTRFYHPILTRAIGGVAEKRPMQTVAAPGNPQAAIMAGTEVTGPQ